MTCLISPLGEPYLALNATQNSTQDTNVLWDYPILSASGLCLMPDRWPNNQ